ncbi:hypothetical protein B0H17DRAFT_1179355 [Mycena rosella]|uniref:Uncharacterized protein n=1 Tax=Mycena rosella TaxID=1033263 RepID=A0AAD7GID1_MYCRO|nr:hypothetical protein B0H17DRAFT_1179355 [Mycena rosella]
MRRIISPVFGLLFLATGSLSANIAVSTLANVAILQCGEVTFSWTGGEGPYTVVDRILTPIDLAGTNIVEVGVELNSYTVLVNYPAGTTAYFTVSDGFEDSGSTDTFTICSSTQDPIRKTPCIAHSVPWLTTHRVGNPTSDSGPTSGPLPTSAGDDTTSSTKSSTNIGAIAGGAAGGGAVVVLLIGLCWWMVKRRNRASTTASPKVLESAGPTEKAVSVLSKRAPPMQQADTDVTKVDLQPSVELYGHKIGTPSSAALIPPESVAYNEQTPVRTMVNNANPEIHEDRLSAEEQDFKTVMSWEPAGAQGSTSGSKAGPSHGQELEQMNASRLRSSELNELRSRIRGRSCPPPTPVRQRTTILREFGQQGLAFCYIPGVTCFPQQIEIRDHNSSKIRGLALPQSVGAVAANSFLAYKDAGVGATEQWKLNYY